MQKKVELSTKETANRINVLQQKCKEIATEKEDVLSNQFDEVERLRKELHFAQLHAKDAISNHTPDKILSVKKADQALAEAGNENLSRIYGTDRR